MLLWLAGAWALAGRVLSPTETRDEGGVEKPRATVWDRAMLALALSTLGPVWLAYGLGLARGLSALPVLVASVLVSVAMGAAGGRLGLHALREDLRALGRATRDAFAGVHAGLALAGALAVGLALWATYLLIPWAWDALGYHLPLVHDAIATRTLRQVPAPAEYINAYPHATDVFTLWWRLLLRDDTWIECTQLPFALMGACGLASLAERAGASRGRALAYALAWLAVPAVALQLACNYVDAAFASWTLMAVAFVAGPLDGRGVVIASLGVAGLLSTKPSAPPAAVFVTLALLVRAYLLRRRGEKLAPAWAWGLALLVLLGGASTFVMNVLRYGNPLFPVRLKVGPVALPGKVDSSYFFNLGLPEALRSRGWFGRLMLSWFTPPDRYIYDMRAGGMGPAFGYVLVPLSIALVALRRELRSRAWPFAVIFAATLATPGAFWPRYTLAAPAALLALCAAGSEDWGALRRRSVDGLLAALVLAGLWLSRGGWTDNGPRLWELARMSEHERALRVNIDLHEADWRRARAWIAPGEGFAYELGFGLPGQLWAPHALGRVEYLEARPANSDALVRWVRERRVRGAVFCQAPEGSIDLARRRPEVFEQVFEVPYDACFTFRVRD